MLLQVLGALALLCVAGLFALFWFIRQRVKRQYAYHRAAGIHRFPQRIRLRGLEPFTWAKPERAGQRVEAFHKLGFRDLGGYTVDELPGARLFALQHPANGLVGLVDEHPQLGTWSDVLRFTNGEPRPLLASSILKRVHFFLLPGSPKIHKADATEEELITAVSVAAAHDAAAVLLNAEEFAARYEEAFAVATDTRLLEPLEDAELRRFLREQCQPCGTFKLSDKEFSEVKRFYPEAIANELRLTCAAQFLRETRLPASQWQDSRERLLVLHDRTPLAALTRRLVYGAYLTKLMKTRLRRFTSATPRADFAQFNASLPPWERYRKLGQVTRPVIAEIYCAPTPGQTT